MKKTTPEKRFKSALTKVFVFWSLVLIGLSLAPMAADAAEAHWKLDKTTAAGLKAMLFSALVLAMVWFMRKNWDRGFPLNIGLEGGSKSFLKFLLGMSFFIAPFLLTVLFTLVLTWAA